MKIKLLIFISLAIVHLTNTALITQTEQDQERRIKAFTDAAYTNKKDKVESFLKEGIDVNSKGPGGQTALQRAASQGHVEMVAFLLQNGANPNNADRQDITPLMAAVMSYPSRPNLPGIENMVKLLIARGAQINVQNLSGQTALMIAVASQLYPIVQILLEANANIWIKNSYNQGPLDFINDKTIQDLEQRALTAIKEKETATEKEKVEALEKEIALVQQQIDNITRIRALFAIKEKTIKEFLDAAATNNKEKVETLLNAGTPLMSSDAQGRTALHQAASQGHVEMVKLLLKKGAHIETSDAIGQTPLHLAAGNGQVNMVAFLLQQGANPSSLDKENNTPLMAAILSFPKYRNVAFLTKITETLLEKGIDLNHQNKSGQTALILAAANGLDTIAQMLLDIGANVELQDNLSRKAIDWAQSIRNTTIENMLKKTNKEVQEQKAETYKEVLLLSAERDRLDREEAERKEQEALRLKQQQEEARRLEELRRKQEQEAEARRQEELRRKEAQRKEQEALRLKQQQDEARRQEELRRQQEEEARKKEEAERLQLEENRLPIALDQLGQRLNHLQNALHSGPKRGFIMEEPGTKKHQ